MRNQFENHEESLLDLPEEIDEYREYQTKVEEDDILDVTKEKLSNVNEALWLLMHPKKSPLSDLRQTEGFTTTEEHLAQNRGEADQK